jgi:hypothetical protein
MHITIYMTSVYHVHSHMQYFTYFLVQQVRRIIENHQDYGGPFASSTFCVLGIKEVLKLRDTIENEVQ